MDNFLNLNKIEKSLNKLVYKNDPIKESFKWNGSPHKNKMHTDYGYIKGTDSQDGEELDVYIKPNSNKKTCFMIT